MTGGRLQTPSCAENEDVYIVGGANAAGRLLMHFFPIRPDRHDARQGRLALEVDVALPDGADQATGNLRVRLNMTVVEVHGQNRLEAITIRDAAGMRETIPTNASSSSSSEARPSGWRASCSETTRGSLSRDLTFNDGLRAGRRSTSVPTRIERSRDLCGWRRAARVCEACGRGRGGRSDGGAMHSHLHGVSGVGVPELIDGNGRRKRSRRRQL